MYERYTLAELGEVSKAFSIKGLRSLKGAGKPRTGTPAPHYSSGVSDPFAAPGPASASLRESTGRAAATRASQKAERLNAISAKEARLDRRTAKRKPMVVPGNYGSSYTKGPAGSRDDLWNSYGGS